MLVSTMGIGDGARNLVAEAEARNLVAEAEAAEPFAWGRAATMPHLMRNVLCLV